jgi:hypothetical protein
MGVLLGHDMSEGGTRTCVGIEGAQERSTAEFLASCP